jgi:CheY-specific phosphatase CheX
MGIQFFGEFLIDRWIITRGQLIEAIELQEYRNLKLGAVAIQKGFLTEEQVRQVNEKQKTTDMRFADLAVSLGMLTEVQAHEIVVFQKNNHLFLGEALLELGHITEDILERELSIFKEEQSRYALEKVVVPEGVASADLVEVGVDLTRKMFSRVVGVLVKTGVGKIEDRPEEAVRNTYHLSVAVPMDGAQTVKYVLSVSSEVAVAIATAILREDATRETEEVVEDAVKEFCNVVCGNAVAKLAQLGIQVDIGPPESLGTLPTPPEGLVAVVFPVYLAEGGVDLRFLVGRRP